MMSSNAGIAGKGFACEPALGYDTSGMGSIMYSSDRILHTPSLHQPEAVIEGEMASGQGGNRSGTMMHSTVGTLHHPSYIGTAPMSYSIRGTEHHPTLEELLGGETTSGHGGKGASNIRSTLDTPHQQSYIGTGFMTYSNCGNEHHQTVADLMTRDTTPGLSDFGRSSMLYSNAAADPVVSNTGLAHPQTLHHSEDGFTNLTLSGLSSTFGDHDKVSSHTVAECTHAKELRSSPSELALPPIDASCCCPAHSPDLDELNEAKEEDSVDILSISLTFDGKADAPDLYDARSVISSDASTVVSRSARRRRGRRAAKARAAQASLSTFPILESPAVDELLVSAERKCILSNQLEAGGHETSAAISEIRGSVYRMAFEPYGCWVVQSAFTVAMDASVLHSLVAELHGHVLEAISSPHANHVIQKVVEVLPISCAHFVAEELLNFAAEAARHRYGCRILCRLVEHGETGTNNTTSELIDELLLETDKLIRHNFARHVIEKVIEHGTRSQKETITRAIRNDVFRNAKCRYASYVVEQVLTHNEMPERDGLAADLVGDPESFLATACHECGCHVIKALTKSRGSSAARGKELLLDGIAQVRASRHGQRLLEEIQ
jgi:pumilio RNA-binding family